MKYIGFYDLLDSSMKRNASLAAVNKMNYIAQSLSSVTKNVEIISPSWYVEKKGKITGKLMQKLDTNISVTFTPSYCTSNRLMSVARAILSKIWLFLYLIIKIKKNEEIIVYHSLALIKPIKWVKKIKKFKLILEVEEIYTDVIEASQRMRKQEFKMISLADKYIFSTELLNESINKANKPYVIIYGTYQVEEKIETKFQDGRIHAVYAGTLDPTKGGAAAAASAAEFLDKSYHIHIIGFGSETEKENLIKQIKDTQKDTECKITYDGLLRGEEYIRFIQKCHIGLSTQTPDASYNDTSFPSKVLSYMANGLRVVSVRIKALERAKIGDLIYFYDGKEPRKIAEAIKAIDINDIYDSRNNIRQLNEEFCMQLKGLLEK